MQSHASPGQASTQANCTANSELKSVACREKDKKKKKGGDADAESGGDSPGSPGEEGDVVWMTDTSEQAAKDRAQAQLTKAMADMVTQVCASQATYAVLHGFDHVHGSNWVGIITTWPEVFVQSVCCLCL